ncbi:MAG: SDR family NAD(P)-dependent oxidoreductase [Dysgonamonadaceae bacterium]|nr:SDR family NAD(P)-dependent oxidoreductase [Dysgonamonadaceae bacterium]MDD4727945.1 SDR family NAD(P)-dependent oxidoreductase [Dysgonamonadaceae bacterium]
MNKVALITGATSGIGDATANLLAEMHYDIIITGRRAERLESLKAKLEKGTSRVLSLCFDVRNENEVKNVFRELPESWRKIDVLINNAGLAAGLEPIDCGNSNDWNRMIDTNVKGLLYISYEVAQIMKNNNNMGGHIVNIGSIAGKEVYPNGNVYCATKHAVDALSKGMRMDLLKHNIKVTQICPGAVETEFSLVRFHNDSERAKTVYEGFEALVAKDIADCIWFAISRPKHVNINDMIVMPTAQASSSVILKKGET